MSSKAYARVWADQPRIAIGSIPLDKMISGRGCL